MTKAQIRDAILRIQSEQIALYPDIPAEYYSPYRQHKPREPAQTEHDQTLTEPAKRDIFYVIGGKISRIVKAAKKRTEEKTMKNNFTLADGYTIEIVSLGRDDGSEIIGRNSAGEIACYIATENTTRDRAEIVQAIKDGAKTLKQVFDMWENGLGGDPFNLDYLPEYYQ